MFFNEIKVNLSDILDKWNVKWKEYVALSRAALQTQVSPACLSTIESLVISDALDKYNFEIIFSSGESEGRKTATKYKSNEAWTVYFGAHKPSECKAMSDFLEGFPFAKVKNELKKRREEALIADMKSLFVGLSITDVIDNGEVIRIELSNEKTYEYRDFLRISDRKNSYGL